MCKVELSHHRGVVAATRLSLASRRPRRPVHTHELTTSATESLSIQPLPNLVEVAGPCSAHFVSWLFTGRSQAGHRPDPGQRQPGSSREVGAEAASQDLLDIGLC